MSTAQHKTLASLDETTLARDYAYLEKYVGIDKVYLETYRDGTWVAIDHMKMIQNFFKEHGVEIAGGITAVTPPLEKMMQSVSAYSRHFAIQMKQ